MTNKHQIVIIGAGTAGITVAAQLLRKDKSLDIAIIDAADKHYYQPAWTLVGAGTYQYEDTERDMADLIPSGVTWIKEFVKEVLPDENKVTTTGGQTIEYDFLVAAPGVQYNLDEIEGLAETMDKNGVCSNYTNPQYVWEVLQEFKGGNAIFTQPATPIKCGGAPQKIMYLADEYWRKTKVRNQTEILFITPGSVIFGVEPFKTTLMKIVDRKDLQLRFFHELVKIDGEKKEATYRIIQFVGEPEQLCYSYRQLVEGDLESEEVTLPFEMLHLAPPQSAPDFIQRSPLALQEGPGEGWVDVDKNTLQHNVYKNVFSLGDVAHLPTAKTGAAVRKQAPVVVGNLLHLINQDNQAMDDGYHGYSSCPLVTGYGKMLLAEFNYEGRDSDPTISRFVDTSKEQYSMWLLKKYGLPFLYWNLMLKGLA